MMPMQHVPAPNLTGGGRLVSVDGRTLPLRDCRLSAEARGGIARTVLAQRFENPYDEPLRVTYLLPLPHEGAVSGFSFCIGERRVTGEVDLKGRARERFEQAIVEGRTAALVEEERSSLFTQELGNIPPRTVVTAEITIDQRLAWREEGAWEYRFPMTVAPRYLGAPGSVPDAAKITVPIAGGVTSPRLSLSVGVHDALTAAPTSPSHGIDVTTDISTGDARNEDLRSDDSAARIVRFAEPGGVPLDRDVVVRWSVAQAQAGISLCTMQPSAGRANSGDAFGLLTIVPPSPSGRTARVRRDLIVLLDTSGSMDGEPLAQAQQVVSELIASLDDEDQIELIEFSSAPRRWQTRPRPATSSVKRSAIAWLKALRASSSTEMQSAIIEALQPLRADSQRQIVLVSDGLIGSEAALVGTILRELPAGSRLHALGVGSSVNRSLMGPAARAGRGVEVVIGLGESPTAAAAALLARTNVPVLVELSIGGSALVEHAPQRLPDLFAGAPLLASLKLRPEGGDLHVSGTMASGAWSRRLTVSPSLAGTGDAAIAALYAREAVEDLETRRAGEAIDEAAADRAIEALGIDFQIATRRTSWVAISDDKTVDPRQVSRREEIPHTLPHGMSVQGLGLRAGAAAFAPAPVAPAAERWRSASASDGMMQSPVRSFEVTGSAPFADLSTPAGPGVVQRVVREIATRVGAAFTPAPPSQKPSPSPSSSPSSGRSAPPSAPPSALKKSAGVAQGAGAVKPATLRGRVVLRRGRALVIEIVLDGRLNWGLPADAWVTSALGEIVAVVVAEQTTEAGSYRAGQTLRLSLTLDRELGSDDAEALLHVVLGAPMHSRVQL